MHESYLAQNLVCVCEVGRAKAVQSGSQAARSPVCLCVCVLYSQMMLCFLACLKSHQPRQAARPVFEHWVLLL